MPIKKRHIIIGIFLAAPIVVLVIIFTLRSSSNSPTPPGSDPANLPSYTLTGRQEEHARLVTQIALEGYNTYSRNDVRELTDVQSNATPAMAAEIARKLESIRSDSRYLSYTIVTTSDPETFQYRYPSAGRLYTEIEADVEENGKKYRIRGKLEFIQEGTTWLLDSIIITKL